MSALRTMRAATIAALLFVPAPVVMAEPAAAGTHASADLDQCRNGPAPSPVRCADRAWVNGNANATHAHYVEGDSIPYRLRFDDLALGTHAVTIEWDTTERAKHALDYLTAYDRTETEADPCTDVPGCGNRATFSIPADPAVAAAGVAQVAGSFALFNGTISGVSGYTVDGHYDGTSQTSITVTFTADAPNPVLAWSGHIATRADWGVDASAAAIDGSPYHMRLLDLDGRGGNQDRALAVDAVVFPVITPTTTTPTTTTTGPTTTLPPPATSSPLPTTTADAATTTTGTPNGPNDGPGDGAVVTTTVSGLASDGGPGAGPLAFTGSHGRTLALIAAALVATGVACVIAGRRRRAASRAG